MHLANPHHVISRSARGPARGAMWTFILAALCVSATAAAASGPGESGEVVRIQCLKRGVYKISGADLAEAGVDLEGLDPNRLALVHFDRAIPFHLKLKRPGRMRPRDALYFFSDGGQVDTIPYVNMGSDYDPRTQTLMLHLDGPRDQRAIYQARRAKLPVTGEPVIPNRAVSGRYHFERDAVWEFFDARSKTDYLFWKKLTRPQSSQTKNSMTNPFLAPWALPDRPIEIEAKFQGVSRQGRHRVEILANDANPQLHEWGEMEDTVARYTVDPAILKPGGEMNMLTIRLAEPTRAKPPKPRSGSRPRTAPRPSRPDIEVVMVDWFDVNYKRATVVFDDYAEFLILDEEDQRGLRQCRISGFTSPDVMVFDPDTRTVWDGGVFGEGQNDQEYYVMNIEHPTTTTALIAVTDARCRTDAVLDKVTLRGRFDRPDDCELLILTHPLFRDELEPLVEWKRSRGLRVSMVDIHDLFQERTGGYPSPYALRDYIRHVYESQSEPQLRYVMLVGDASSISKYKTYCPNYAYTFSGREANENFFGSFEDPFGPPVVAVGRLPVRTAEETRRIVRKILDYESGRGFGPWRARFFTIAANPNWASAVGEELIDDYYLPHYLSTFVETTLDDDGRDYAWRMNDRLVNQFNMGNVFVCYIGHGGGTIWELGPTARPSEFTLHLFDQSSIERLTNVNGLPVVYSMSCYTNNFDNPHISQTMGESFLHSEGGAIAVIGAATRSEIVDNYRFLGNFLDIMGRHVRPRLGDAMLDAVNKHDHERLGGRFLLLGDPSLEFGWPRPEMELTRPELDLDDPSITFHYKLPEELTLPAQVDCFLIGEDQTVLAQWVEQLSGREGAIRYPSPEDAEIEKTHRIVLYANQQGIGDFTGHVHLDQEEDGDEREAPDSVAATSGVEESS